jgi:Na+/melibiose symporter-like transporter
VVGGVLVQSFDWHWIFLVNLPICAVGVAVTLLVVPETRAPRMSRRIDVPGILTLTIAIFCLVLALIEGDEWGWSSVPLLSLFGASVGSLLLFVGVELWQREPIVDFSLFKAPSFSGPNSMGLLYGIALQGATLIAVLYFTDALGYHQLHAAYALLPIALTGFVASATCGKASSKIGPHLICLVGMALAAVGLGLLSQLSPETSYLEIAWRGVVMGAGIGMAFQSLPTLALSETPHAKLGVVSGVFTTFRQLGIVLGVAILISVLNRQLHTNLAQIHTHAGALVHAQVVRAFTTRNPATSPVITICRIVCKTGWGSSVFLQI